VSEKHLKDILVPVLDTQDYDVESLYVSQGIQITGLPSEILLNSTRMCVAYPLHLSLFTPKHYAAALAEMLGSNKAAYQKLKQASEFMSKQCEGLALHLLPQTRVVVREDRQTLIVMVDVQGLDELYGQLATLLGIDLEVVPAHITLYVLPGSKGIGLTTAEHLQTLTRELTRKEQEELKQSGFAPKLVAV
jgi:hypothetical protein